jgi:hypothetical protein
MSSDLETQVAMASDELAKKQLAQVQIVHDFFECMPVDMLGWMLSFVVTRELFTGTAAYSGFMQLNKKTREAMKGRNFFSMGMCRAFDRFCFHGIRAMQHRPAAALQSAPTFSYSLGPPLSVITGARRLSFRHCHTCNDILEDHDVFHTECSAVCVALLPGQSTVHLIRRFSFPHFETVCIPFCRPRGARKELWDLLIANQWIDVMKQIVIDGRNDSNEIYRQFDLRHGLLDCKLVDFSVLESLRSVVVIDQPPLAYDVRPPCPPLSTKEWSSVESISFIMLREIRSDRVVRLLSDWVANEYYDAAVVGCRLRVIRFAIPSNDKCSIMDISALQKLCDAHASSLRVFSCRSLWVGEDASSLHLRRPLPNYESPWKKLQQFDVSTRMDSLNLFMTSMAGLVPRLRIVSVYASGGYVLSLCEPGDWIRDIELLLVDEVCCGPGVGCSHKLFSLLCTMRDLQAVYSLRHFVCLNRRWIVDLNSLVSDTYSIVPGIDTPQLAKQYLLENMRSFKDFTREEEECKEDSTEEQLSHAFDKWWMHPDFNIVDPHPDVTPVVEVVSDSPDDDDDDDEEAEFADDGDDGSQIEFVNPSSDSSSDDDDDDESSSSSSSMTTRKRSSEESMVTRSKRSRPTAESDSDSS